MEGGLSFLNVRASVVMDQYFGNSNKKVAAVFSLAAKLQPCIIFIGAHRKALIPNHALHALNLQLWLSYCSQGIALHMGPKVRVHCNHVMCANKLT